MSNQPPAAQAEIADELHNAATFLRMMSDQRSVSACKQLAADALAALAAYRSTPSPAQAGTAQAEPPNPWKEAVIDACVIACIDWDEKDPRKTLHQLICWENQIALDPKVSSAAQALVDQGRSAAQAEPAASAGEPSYAARAKALVELHVSRDRQTGVGTFKTGVVQLMADVAKALREASEHRFAQAETALCELESADDQCTLGYFRAELAAIRAALSAPAQAASAAVPVEQQQAGEWREALTLARPYVMEAANRFYDGTGGHAMRAEASRRLELIDAAIAAASAQPQPAVEQQASLQARVEPWLMACFGHEISGDKIERNHRFLEEALELVQACGCTRDEAHQLVDYVFGRPVGEAFQEAGGVAITLAALCRAQGLDMHEAGEAELARIWTKVEQIRAKQAAKPKHSPLPEATRPAAQQVRALTEADIQGVMKLVRHIDLAAVCFKPTTEWVEAVEEYLRRVTGIPAPAGIPGDGEGG